jgi:uncharacterized protein with GYD domain
MTTYVILSRFSPEAFREPHEFKKLTEAVSAKIKSECSGIRWKDSYATLGRFDVVDVVEANDPKQIEKAAMIIRAYGHSTRSRHLNSGSRYVATFPPIAARFFCIVSMPSCTAIFPQSFSLRPLWSSAFSIYGFTPGVSVSDTRSDEARPDTFRAVLWSCTIRTIPVSLRHQNG